MRTQRRQRRRNSGGFTLIEVILALFLSVIVLSAITTAIFLHVSVLDKRRGRIERAQLARNILHRMADDIRSAVQYKPVDVSQLEQMMSGVDLTSLLASDAAGAMLGEAAESGMTTDDLSGMADSLGGGSQNAATSGLTSGGDMGMEEDSANTTDIASSAAPPTEPGIYGNELELQIDTSRMPRKDQYNPLLAGANVNTTDIPSDIKTIAYYYQEGGLESDLSANSLEDDSASGGLVRREVTRAVARYAVDNGSDLTGLGKADLLAEEVTLVQFRYFDGTEWQTEWDSESTGALPFAIEIQITLTDDPDGTKTDAMGQSEEPVEEVFRLVVHIPMAEEAEEEESTTGGTTGTDTSMDTDNAAADTGAADR